MQELVHLQSIEEERMPLPLQIEVLDSSVGFQFLLLLEGVD